MRAAFLFLLAAVCACGDPGPRDRSLLRKVAKTAPTPPVRKLPRHAPVSVIGLVSDPIAHFYAEDASLIVRFNDMSSLMRRVGPWLVRVSRALPRLGLPSGSADALLRQLLRLPASVAIDPLRPFAFVKTGEGWAAIVPAHDRQQAGARLRQLDGIYCVAGDPRVVALYRPRQRSGHCLPGDCSIIADSRLTQTLGTELTDAFGALGVDLTFLDGIIPSVSDDIKRIDASLRFSDAGLRCDLRLAPARGTASALCIERLKPRAASAVRWLPSGGSLYVELGAALMDWEGLAANVLRDRLDLPDAVEQPGPHSVRRGLSMLGNDAAVMLDMDAAGFGHAFLVATLAQPDAMREYLQSTDLRHLLHHAAGKGGYLQWTENVSAREGIEIGAITGHISRKRLAALRGRGVLPSTLGVLLRGPLIAYAAIVGDKFCLAFGPNARVEMNRLIDALLEAKPGGNGHAAEVDTLFRSRLGSLSMDLAALFDGSREAAGYWHQNGSALKGITLGRRIPVSAAVTVEGSALRIVLRIPPGMLADAAAKIIAALEK